MKTVLFMVVSIVFISVGMLRIDKGNISTNISSVTYSDDLKNIKNSDYKRENQNYTLAQYTEENLIRAKTIHNSIMSDSRINNSYIIVNENYAIVGIDLNDSFTNQDILELENKIITVDKNIKNIVVVDDKELVEDLKYKANYGII